MQTAWNEIKKILPVFGNKVILWGVEDDGEEVFSDGAIIIDGEVYEVVGGSGPRLKKVTEEVTATYNDGNVNTFMTRVYYQTTDDSTSDTIDIASFTTLADWVTNQTKIRSTASLLATVQTTLASIQAALAATNVEVDATNNHIVPQGAIIMWGKPLPTTSATTLADIKAAIPYGYIPAGYLLNNGSYNAWKSYVAELTDVAALSLQTVSFVSYLDFPTVIKAILGYSVDMTQKFAVCADNNKYKIGTSYGAESVELTEAHLPYHKHNVADYYYMDDNGSQPSGVSGSGIISHSSKLTTPSGADTASATETVYGCYYNHDTSAAGSTSPTKVPIIPPANPIYYLIKII